MKQGSTDDPFAEDPVQSEEDKPADDQSDDEDAATADSDTQESAVTSEANSSTDESSDSAKTPQRQSLPYIHARNGVKDGRTQRPVFLRDHIEAGIDDLVQQMEAEFGEDVYKTDITEAAMAVAQDNPELVQAKLEEWGYGWT